MRRRHIGWPLRGCRYIYVGLRTGRLCIAPCSIENVDVRIELTLDCAELDRMATFWRDAAGLFMEGVIEGRYVAPSVDKGLLSRCNASMSRRR